MCGRYASSAHPEALGEEFDVDEDLSKLSMRSILAAPQTPPAGQPDFAPLPAYELVARGGVKHTRGPSEPPAAGPLRLVPGSEIDLTLRPSTRVEGPLAVRAFVVQEATTRPWAAPVDVAPTGAMRLHGPVDKLFAGFEGALELRLVVGRAEALGSVDAAQKKALGAESAGPGWQVLRVAVELVKTP